FFFFNDTATTELYPLSLHDALPIFPGHGLRRLRVRAGGRRRRERGRPAGGDRKSTRLNSSHQSSSYAVFCLKKKKNWLNTSLLERSVLPERAGHRFGHQDRGRSASAYGCSATPRNRLPCVRYIFFFNDTATTEIYTLSLHDALPISPSQFAEARYWLRRITRIISR